MTNTAIVIRFFILGHFNPTESGYMNVMTLAYATIKVMGLLEPAS
jgi:hypothetical protein